MPADTAPWLGLIALRSPAGLGACRWEGGRRLSSCPCTTAVVPGAATASPSGVSRRGARCAAARRGCRGSRRAARRAGLRLPAEEESDADGLRTGDLAHGGDAEAGEGCD